MADDRSYDMNVRKEMESPTAQKMLRQWLNTDGPKGNNDAYDRGYEFSFRFTEEQRTAVNQLVADGTPFEAAFDIILKRSIP